MTLLIPIGLLLTATLLVAVLHWVRPGFGLSWLGALGLAFLAWLALIFLGTRLPESWLPLANDFPFQASTTLFLLDAISWPYAVMLTTLAVAVMLTEAARTQYKFNPMSWSSTMLMTAAGLVAVMAGNPFTLAIGWTAVDVVELAIMLSGAAEQRLSERIVVAFGVRVIGTLLMIFGMSISRLPGDTFDLSLLSETGILFFILACGLRLGILPLHQPFSQEPRLRRGLGNMLRLVPPAAALVCAARLPASTSTLLSSGWIFWLSGLLGLAVVYGSVMWLSAKNELEGRPFWLIGWSGLAMICILHGHPQASLAWGAALLLPGSLLFLYSARSVRLVLLPALGFWAISGLPFSMTASGWAGVLDEGFSLWNIFMVVSVALFLTGYIRHVFREEMAFSEVDRWAQAVYPAGLLLMALMPVYFLIWGWEGSAVLGSWWAGLTAVVLSVAVSWFFGRPNPQAETTLEATSHWAEDLTSPLLERIAPFLRLDWFYSGLWSLYRGLRWLLNAWTRLLEGDGGVLWAMVLLALLVSIISGLSL
ncbi:MAG TPA: hypothetical protein PKW33_15020 [Anaerolineaceae bacterium]|nr:hypothetical protein [Anaerolineaceae bacterium]HPN52904.1 hypothetical protein [Anaerolineaceae bacterium]